MFCFLFLSKTYPPARDYSFSLTGNQSSGRICGRGILPLLISFSLPGKAACCMFPMSFCQRPCRSTDPQHCRAFPFCGCKDNPFCTPVPNFFASFSLLPPFWPLFNPVYARFWHPRLTKPGSRGRRDAPFPSPTPARGAAPGDRSHTRRRPMTDSSPPETGKRSSDECGTESDAIRPKIPKRSTRQNRDGRHEKNARNRDGGNGTRAKAGGSRPTPDGSPDKGGDRQALDGRGPRTRERRPEAFPKVPESGVLIPGTIKEETAARETLPTGQPAPHACPHRIPAVREPESGNVDGPAPRNDRQKYRPGIPSRLSRLPRPRAGQAFHRHHSRHPYPGKRTHQPDIHEFLPDRRFYKNSLNYSFYKEINKSKPESFFTFKFNFSFNI